MATCLNLNLVPSVVRPFLENADDDFIKSLKDYEARNGGLTDKQHAALIKNFFEACYVAPAAPKASERTGSPVETPGAYETAEGIWRVRLNKDDRQPYAEKITQGKAEYIKGAIFRIFAEDKMTEERAQELSVAWSECIVCGRTLTDPKSIAQGMGDTCKKNQAKRNL